MAVESHVAAAPIACRHLARDEADPLEDVEMVGQQVAGQPELRGQRRGRSVGDGELLDDGEADRLAQGSVHSRLSFDPPVHASDDKSQPTLSQ
jgi:hypothetical protein